MHTSLDETACIDFPWELKESEEANDASDERVPVFVRNVQLRIRPVALPQMSP
jgi:hypothetical protein